jgi:glutathione S-transferase
MRLFDNAFSPYAYKVRAVLYEKGVDFEQRALRTAAEREELRRRNPRDEVPALEDGDTIVYDSTVICEYLEEKYPLPPLMPADPVARARCRTLESMSDGELDAIVFVLGLLVPNADLQARIPDALPRAGDALRLQHARLERELGGDFLVGALSLADVAVYPHLRGANFLGYPVADDHPRLQAWMQRMGQRPSIRRATREMAESFRQFQTDPEPFFSRQRVHWRNDRLEWAIRCGMGRWLLDEIDAGRAFFSPMG